MANASIHVPTTAAVRQRNSLPQSPLGLPICRQPLQSLAAMLLFSFSIWAISSYLISHILYGLWGLVTFTWHIYVRVIGVVANVNSSVLLIAEQVSGTWVYHALFFCSRAGNYLG